MPEAVIVAAARSPIGRARKGSLRDVRPDDLAAAMVRAALDQVPELPVEDVEDLYLGCGNPSGEQGFNIARVVAVSLGLDALPGATISRHCASSLQTTRMAFHAIRAGEGLAYVSGGVECVSRIARPADAQAGGRGENSRYAAAMARSATRAGGGAPPWEDPRLSGELPDVYLAMGQTAENVAQHRGVSRREQDEFAVRSQRAAARALDDGFWAEDITPVTLPDGTVVAADDGPRPGTTLDRLAGLAPVFRPDGTVTAGNCCPLNDGAAALVVMDEDRAGDLGITPLARIRSTGVSALSPEIMGLGPVAACRLALRRAGLGVGDLDLAEINEAFAAQVIPVHRDLGLDEDRLNVHGGAIAVGHPFGMTGARLTATLLHGLRVRDGQFGLVSMCVAGGQGMAMVVERLS
ncbi:acetyl-CoA C-acetyltransferase [Actinoalloteichus caeruleus]|uniref:acetyl-CoA C-acetyltransferase n=1 Tax=Actinoalloteichus cyanogriseus TaxID=2893586 RepID=UPI0004AA16D6|nr:acetyl-CoA C-acetyltransferase [Actinoalloteichus caeruleus]